MKIIDIKWDTDGEAVAGLPEEADIPDGIDESEVADFLSDGENAKYVDSIVISGHTDSTGTDEVNRKLSTDRANAVLNYLLNGKNGKLKDDAGYFCAAGYGATRPVRSNDTEEGRSANRRIEISMILRDETVLDIVDQYLALDLPESSEKVSEQAKRVLH